MGNLKYVWILILQPNSLLRHIDEETFKKCEEVFERSDETSNYPPIQKEIVEKLTKNWINF